jgi:hypothetical protein
MLNLEPPVDSDAEPEEAEPGSASRGSGTTDDDGSSRWPWILGGLVVLAGVALARRGRSE